MKSLLFLFGVSFTLFCAVGCTPMNNLTEGIAEKSISGNGYLGKSKIGIDAATKMPTLEGFLLKGKYTSVPQGMEYVEFTEEQDSSIFNSNSKTYNRRFVFASSEKKRTDEVIAAMKEELKKSMIVEETAPVSEDENVPTDEKQMD